LFRISRTFGTNERRKEMSTLNDLKQNVIEGDAAGVPSLVRQALNESLLPDSPAPGRRKRQGGRQGCHRNSSGRPA
jgi:hypothetical protein